MNVITKLKKLNLYDPHLEIDHLCYRTSSLENYQQICLEVSSFGRLLIESKINGRLISTYKLKEPIILEPHKIFLIEIPAPKPHKETKEGFEHLEVVIKDSFEKFQQKHSHITFETTAINKELNPDIEVNLGDCAVKFHHLSLEKVIEIEQNQS